MGCRKCIQDHGGITAGQYFKFGRIIEFVSSSLCSGLTTAKFADVFATLAPKLGGFAPDEHFRSDLFPSSTAVSLYFTADRVQGPGVVTGRLAEHKLVKEMAHMIFRKCNCRSPIPSVVDNAHYHKKWSVFVHCYRDRIGWHNCCCSAHDYRS